MRNALLFLAGLSLAGCTASYQTNRLAGVETSARLSSEKGIYVTVPADGMYESKGYAGSGQTVAQALAAAFSTSARQVHIADKMLTKDEALAAARKRDAGYVVTPVITHWEQRATEWSGRPSRMAIRVSILDAISGNQITSKSIEGRSRIVSFTSTNPESLLREPIAAYVNELYR